jgi:hypothetical protein
MDLSELDKLSPEERQQMQECLMQLDLKREEETKSFIELTKAADKMKTTITILKEDLELFEAQEKGLLDKFTGDERLRHLKQLHVLTAMYIQSLKQFTPWCK